MLASECDETQHQLDDEKQHLSQYNTIEFLGEVSENKAQKTKQDDEKQLLSQNNTIEFLGELSENKAQKTNMDDFDLLLEIENWKKSQSQDSSL